MNIAYIDHDEGRGTAFFQAVCRLNRFAGFELLKDHGTAVNYILDTALVPHYIFIHFEFKEIPCEALIRFIRKHTHLDNTRVIVISDHFTRADGLFFNELNVTTHLVRTEDLTAALSETLKPPNGVLRTLRNR